MNATVLMEETGTIRASKYLEWLAKFFVVVAPLAYLGGRYYLEGYLNAYGIDDNLIVIPFDEALVSALWAFTLITLPIVEWVISTLTNLMNFSSIAVAILVLLGSIRLCSYLINARRKKSPDQPRWLRTLRILLHRKLEPKRNATVRAIGINVRIFQAFNYSLLFVLIAFIGGPSIAISADKHGAKIATNEQIKFKEQGCKMSIDQNWSSCVEVVDSNGKTIEKGLLTRRTPLGLAIYNGKETKIVSVGSKQSLRFSRAASDGV